MIACIISLALLSFKSQAQVGNTTIDYIRQFRDIAHANKKFIPIQQIEKYYDLIGFNAIYDVLEESFCHDKGHNVGRIVYSRLGKSLTKSLHACGTRCTGACFHGSLMQYFDDLKESLTDYNNSTTAETLMQSYFNNLCDGENEFQRDFVKLYGPRNESSECFHSLGHVAMSLTDYDHIKAVQICKQLGPKMEAYFCTTGAYHEFFLKYYGQRVGDSLIYPCDKTNDFPAACYRTSLLYKPYYRDKGYQPLAQICMAMHDARQRQGECHSYRLSQHMLQQEKYSANAFR